MQKYAPRKAISVIHRYTFCRATYRKKKTTGIKKPLKVTSGTILDPRGCVSIWIRREYVWICITGPLRSCVLHGRRNCCSYSQLSSRSSRFYDNRR
nr:unnamed protein product [Callosobruchus chinensis]